jgi:DNA-binding NtrC family response regulator
LLASRFLAASSQSSGKRIGGFDADAIDALMRFDWPGNVRQLQNEIARSVALAADGQRIARVHLWAAVDGSGRTIAISASPTAPSPVMDDSAGAFQPLAKARSDFEARYIATALGPYRGQDGGGGPASRNLSRRTSQENQATQPALISFYAVALQVNATG